MTNSFWLTEEHTGLQRCDFVQGHMSGQGKMKTKEGASYDGGWLNDQYEGEGTYISAEGEVTKGRFHAGQLIEQHD